MSEHETFHIEAADGGTLRVDASMEIEVTSHLWLRWVDIAIDRETEAQRARTMAYADRTNRGSDFATGIETECNASMQAVVSAAFALEAFHKAVQRLLTSPLPRQPSASLNVLQSLTNGFQISGMFIQQWQQDIPVLFDSRNNVVHYSEQPGLQPTHPLGMPTSRLHAEYTIEKSNHSLDLVLEIFSTCVSQPNPTHKALVTYVADKIPAVQDRVQRRYAIRNPPNTP